MGPLWECLGVLVCVPQSPSPNTHLMGLQSWMSQSMHFSQHFMVALLVCGSPPFRIQAAGDFGFSRTWLR